MRVLVDTNVFLDVLPQRKEFMEDSLDTLKKLLLDHDQIFVSASTLKDIYYFAFRTFHDSFSAVRYVNDVYERISKVISLSADDVIEAIYQDGDYEDNCLVASARRTMCDVIITRNIRDFDGKEIPALTPSEFLHAR